jgi:hypothetical protein
MYLGDFPVGGIVDKKWNSQGPDGASVTLGDSGTLRLVKGNDDTPRASLAGVTFTEDFTLTTGQLIGVHHLRIDLEDDTDPGWYAAGSEIEVLGDTIVVAGKTVNTTLFSFSIERAGGALALLKSATAGLSVSKTVLDAIKLQTDLLPSDPADQSLVIAATDAIMARLGVPAGASIVADIASVGGGAAPSAADNAAAVWAKVIEQEGSVTAQQALSVGLAVLGGVTANTGLTFKTPNGNAVRLVATVNALNERLTITLTPSA